MLPAGRSEDGVCDKDSVNSRKGVEPLQIEGLPLPDAIPVERHRPIAIDEDLPVGKKSRTRHVEDVAEKTTEGTAEGRRKGDKNWKLLHGEPTDEEGLQSNVSFLPGAWETNQGRVSYHSKSRGARREQKGQTQAKGHLSAESQSPIFAPMVMPASVAGDQGVTSKNAVAGHNFMHSAPSRPDGSYQEDFETLPAKVQMLSTTAGKGPLMMRGKEGEEAQPSHEFLGVREGLALSSTEAVLVLECTTKTKNGRRGSGYFLERQKEASEYESRTGQDLDEARGRKNGKLIAHRFSECMQSKVMHVTEGASSGYAVISGKKGHSESGFDKKLFQASEAEPKSQARGREREGGEGVVRDEGLPDDAWGMPCFARVARSVKGGASTKSAADSNKESLPKGVRGGSKTGQRCANRCTSSGTLSPSSAESTITLLGLPSNPLLAVCTFVDHRGLVSLSSTCGAASRLINNDDVWGAFCKRERWWISSSAVEEWEGSVGSYRELARQVVRLEAILDKWRAADRRRATVTVSANEVGFLQEYLES
eukprot:TRINITY_DN8859_c0_g1_i1.p1 TRINITY_DN8859_c0_g1~~TRINITY_DN8859_c0_g1_i1.p1  ORF type:complete len:537 (-),score=62.74 TRINITY_DN8859_c0_g1_i1:400-2010(-)